MILFIILNYSFECSGKYLQMMTAYFIFKEDSESLAHCYEKFNKTYSDLCGAFKEAKSL